MHKERILALADLIEQQRHTVETDSTGFNMSDYIHPCGTPCCMAGFAAWERLGRPEEINLSGSDIVDHACAYFGITSAKMRRLVDEELFRGNYCIDENRGITPSRAATVLRNFAETGEVDWSVSPLLADNGRAE